MATAALRGILVVAAVVLGIVVMARAFPGSAPEVQPRARQSPSADEPQTITTPTLPATGTGPATTAPATAPNPADVKDVTIQVLNGTNKSGLAASTATKLEEAGYKVTGVANAARTYQVTTLFYRSDSQAQAEQLAAALFPGAKLEVANNNLNPKVRITVVVGTDYADQG